MPLEVTRQLAEFAVRTRDEDIPPPVYAQAKLAIADSMGTVFTGLKERPVELLHELAVADHATYQRGKASVLGSRCPRA